jgi:hypothetical protein
MDRGCGCRDRFQVQHRFDDLSLPGIGGAIAPPLRCADRKDQRFAAPPVIAICPERADAVADDLQAARLGESAWVIFTGGSG